MATGYYLLDNPNPNYKQYRIPRRYGRLPSGVVTLHTFEWPWKRGANPAAAWLTTRDTPGSYHRLCDWADILPLAPWWAECWQDMEVNPHGVGIAAAVYADEWNTIPAGTRLAIVRNMARAAADYAKWLKATRGITLPARRITWAQAKAGVPGFCPHSETNPGRRSDVGRAFPWGYFFEQYERFVAADQKVGGVTHTPETEELTVAEVDRIIEAVKAESARVMAGLASVHEDADAARNHANKTKMAVGRIEIAMSGLAQGDDVDTDALAASIVDGLTAQQARIVAELVIHRLKESGLLPPVPLEDVPATGEVNER